MSVLRIPILLYHLVSNQPSPAIASFSVTPTDFERHLDLIVEGGHRVLSVSALADALAGNDPLPPAPVVITFDDGFAETLEVAAPRLDARRLPATIYLTTGYLSGGQRESGVTRPGRMLRWTEVHQLELAGLEVGAHSHTHAHLDILPRPRAGEEVRRSKELLEGQLGHRVRSFAYPHGYANSFLRREVAAAGFDSACGVRNAFSHPQDDRLCLARLTVRASTPPQRIGDWLRGSGAPLAGPREALRTRAWREARRLRHFASGQPRAPSPT
jgi:peptidoglycan/xylan/chitin deacetylase (PgdA/CDA1 family)